MHVELRPLTVSDVDAHNSGEDAQTIRWLSGAPSTRESTRAHIAQLARNHDTGRGAQGYGVWADDRLAGYVEANPDVRDGLAPSDVNISYATHPWARGRGVATAAIAGLCAMIRDRGLGARAAIRVEPDNIASVRVARACGFRFDGEFISATDTHPDGTPARMHRYLLDLDRLPVDDSPHS